MMGTKGLKGIEKLLIGSVENVIRHYKIPVMIVRWTNIRQVKVFDECRPGGLLISTSAYFSID